MLSYDKIKKFKILESEFTAVVKNIASKENAVSNVVVGIRICVVTIVLMDQYNALKYLIYLIYIII